MLDEKYLLMQVFSSMVTVTVKYTVDFFCSVRLYFGLLTLLMIVY